MEKPCKSRVLFAHLQTFCAKFVEKREMKVKDGKKVVTLSKFCNI